MSLPTASAFGFSGVDWGAALIERDWNKSDAADARQANERSSEQQMAFQREMSNTAYQRATKDMLAAGINPMLAFQQGGASSPQGAGYTAPLAHASTLRGLAGFTTAAQVENIRANTEKTEAEAKEIEARTPTHAVSREQMQQQVKESQQRVQNLIQEVSNLKAGEKLTEQQIKNLEEAIPQIRATVTNLQASTALHQAQQHQAYTQSGLTAAQDEETRQRIRANLPELKNALDRLEATARQYAMPGRSNEAQVQQSWVGALGAILKALNPLSNFTR